VRHDSQVGHAGERPDDLGREALGEQVVLLAARQALERQHRDRSARGIGERRRGDEGLRGRLRRHGLAPEAGARTRRRGGDQGSDDGDDLVHTGGQRVEPGLTMRATATSSTSVTRYAMTAGPVPCARPIGSWRQAISALAIIGLVLYLAGWILSSAD